MLNALTIDVEDYYHVTAFEGQVSRRQWDQYPSRVERNTRRLLEVLARHGVRATFFVLGWVGHRFPGLVREIAAAGHEVGCHSYWHRLIYRLTPDEFRQDLKQARVVLENALGGPVTAYRAPCYSVTRASLWALEILQEEGFRYDSSIHPIWHDRYGIPDAERFPHRIVGATGSLWEFPPSVLRFGKMNLPISGGGYFRLYPARWTDACLRWVNSHYDCPFMFYLHPWEIDPDQPRLPCPRGTRFRHYLNLSRTLRRLEWLLGRFEFGPLSEALHCYQDACVTESVGHVMYRPLSGQVRV
jgi:polysaccharide deacetylase family protein (PEP-CTERM system associated)